MGSLFGGIAYGVGWIFVAAFYGRLGISPEDAGIGASWLAIRALFVVAIFALVSYLGIHASRASRFSSPVTYIIRSRLAVAFVRTLAPSALIAVSLAGVIPVLASPRFGQLTLICAAALSGLIITVRIRREYRHNTSTSAVTLAWDVRLSLKALSAAVIAFSVVFVTVGSYLSARALANDVQSGRSVSFTTFPGMTGLRVERMMVVPATLTVSDTLLPRYGRCLLRLGDSDSMTLFWDPDKHAIVRIGNNSFAAIGYC